MFVGYFEISISVTVKHVQSIGNIRAFSFFFAWGDLLRFSMPGETEEVAGLWFARGGTSTQADTMGVGWKEGHDLFEEGGRLQFLRKK